MFSQVFSFLSLFFLFQPLFIHIFLSSCIKICLHVHHANIVQAVKTCYKIKIDYRVLVCCFYGVLQYEQYLSLTIKPLLQSDSATIRVQKRLYCMTIVTVLECKSGSMAEKSGSFATLILKRFVRKPHNLLYINTLSLNAQNSRISHQRFCCALSPQY